MSQSQGTRWDALTDVARRCVAEKQFDKAEEAFLAALREAEQFGETDQRVAATLNALARVYHRRSKFFPAAALLHRLLAVKEREHGENHPELAGILNNLADMYAKLGDARQELELRERALAIRVGAGEAEGAPLEALRSRIAELTQKIAEEKAREAALRNVAKRIQVPTGATDLPLILPTPVASPRVQPLSPAFLPRKADASESVSPPRPLRSEAAVAPAPVQPEPIAPVRPEPLAPLRTEPIIPLRAEPATPVRPERVTPPRPEPVAPVRTEPVVPMPIEPVAPLRTEPIAPLRTEPIGAPSMEPIAPPGMEPIAPLRTEPVAPLRTEPVAPLRAERIGAPSMEPIAPPPMEPIVPPSTAPITPPPSSALVLRNDLASPMLPPVERTLPGDPLFAPAAEGFGPPAFRGPGAPLVAGIRDGRTPSPVRTSAVIPPAFARATFATPFGMNSAPPASAAVPVEGPFAPLTALPPIPEPLGSIAPPPTRGTSGPSWAPLAPPAPDTSWPAHEPVDDTEAVPDDWADDGFELRPRRNWRPMAVGGAAIAAVAVIAVLVLGRPETAGSASGELATPPAAQVEPDVEEVPVEELPPAAPPLAPLEAEALQFGLANVEAAANAGTAKDAGVSRRSGLESRFDADTAAAGSNKLNVRVPSLSLDKVTENIDAATRERLDSLAKANDQKVYEYKGKKPRQ